MIEQINSKNNRNEIMVSIFCLAYNHESFIRDALEGFVGQKTNFKFEVLIHDDASTDKTADIIREYEKKYPDIIKPIYQTQNQYSQSIPIFNTYIWPRVKGKYVAVCEGDDFWTSPTKLQQQVDILEKNPEYSACTHCVLRYDFRNGEKTVFNPTDKDYIFETKDLIEWGSKRFLTSSLVMRKDLCKTPTEICMSKVGDYPRAVYLAINGPIYYMREVMSTYRYCTPGSWSSKNTVNHDALIQALLEKNEYLDRLNNYTAGEYYDVIIATKRKNNFDICCYKNDFKAMVVGYKEFLRKCPIGYKFRAYINAYFPRICEFRRKIKKGINLNFRKK